MKYDFVSKTPNARRKMNILAVPKSKALAKNTKKRTYEKFQAS